MLFPPWSRSFPRVLALGRAVFRAAGDAQLCTQTRMHRQVCAAVGLGPALWLGTQGSPGRPEEPLLCEG